MTAIAASQFQQAVFALLQGDAALVARLQGIYDEPPVDAPLPYLSLGETRLSANGVKDRDGTKIQFEVNLWSADRSQMDMKEMTALVASALTGTKPSVPGHELVMLRFENATIVRQFMEGGSLYRGRLSFYAQLFEAA